MMFVKGGLLSLAVPLLFFSLLLGNFFIMLSLSSSNEVIKESLSSNFDEIIESFGKANISEGVKERIDEMNLYCQENNNTGFVFSNSGYTVDISCETVYEGEDAIIKEGVNDIIDVIYYQEYSCSNPWNCVYEKQEPLYFLSQQAKDYWNNKMYYFIAASLLLIFLMFFLVEKKENLFIIAGSLLILSSLPFAKIEGLFSFIDYSYLKIIPILLSKSFIVFVVAFSIGIILLAFGIAFKFFNFGSFILEKFDKSDKGSKNKKIK